VQRTLRSRVNVNARYDVRYALATATDFRLPSLLSTVTVRDDGSYNRPADLALVRTDGNLTVDLVTSIVDKISAASVSSLISSSQLLPLPNYPTRATPTRSGEAQLNLLKEIPHYWYRGQRYTMDRLTSNPSNVTLATPTPATNPLNVWYADATRTFGGNVTLNGTLVIVGNNTVDVIVNGRTVITARNDTTTGRPVLPALIVDRDVIFSSTGRRLEVTGLTWIGRDIRQTGLVNALNPLNAAEFRGALMFAGNPSRIDSSYTGSFEVRYQRNVVQDLWDLSDTDRIPQSVKVVSWGR
jgi:hypothetical protein